MGRYKLEPITPGSLTEIENDWIKSAGEDVFELELAVIFDHYRKIGSLELGENESYIFGLFDTSGDCLAIADMVSSKRRSVSKLLKPTLSPIFISDSEEIKESQKQTLAEVYAALFSNVVAYETSRDYDEVRIYANTADTLNLLDRVATNWDTKTTGHTANMTGRWLKISRQTKG